MLHGTLKLGRAVTAPVLLHPPHFLLLLSSTRPIYWVIANCKDGFLVCLIDHEYCLEGEFFTTAKPVLIDAFDPIVKDEDAINDTGASTRMRFKESALQREIFLHFLSSDWLKEMTADAKN